MLSSITPLGERNKGNRWGVTVSAHLLGATLGGAAAGSVAWLLGAPVRALLADAALLGVVLAGTAAAALLEARPGLVPRLPGWRRQVDEGWLDAYRGIVYGAGFGVQLGAAVATIVTTAAIPLVLLAAAAMPPFAGGLAIGVAFGAARGATVLAGWRVTDPERLRRFHRRFEAGADRARRAAAVALGTSAVVVAAATGLAGAT